MATDFFQRQDDARRNTGWLVGMFSLAVVGVVGATFAAAAGATYYAHGKMTPLSGEPFPWQVPIFAAVGALLLILGGSLFKVVELKAGGGAGVAERLRGRRLQPNSTGYIEKRLLNVVEEMAIASGVPAPPVYLLEEEGINAFAAGYSPSDAVVGVTRGCAEKLTREELQGVIAHEFSHILNGDMRMSIRLIGVLHGILLLGLVGQLIFRSMAFSGAGRSRSSNKDNGSGVLVLMAVAVTLIVLGFVGTFFGGLIKAAVSRQREYLADASAVQFTRNPQGIGGALKRIGGAVHGSLIDASNASELSHMYFAQGVWEGFSNLTATHPPLRDRIKRIDPEWDGKFTRESVDTAHATATAALGGAAAGFAGGAGLGSMASGVTVAAGLAQAGEHVGSSSEAHRQYALDVLATMPESVVEAAHDPHGARAVVYCLLLDKDAGIRQKQLQALQSRAEPDAFALTQKLAPEVDRLEPRSRLPLVDMTMPALRSLSPAQYKRMSGCLNELVSADGRLDLFEWTLAQVLMRHLQPQLEKTRQVGVRYYGLQRLGEPCSVVLSTLARVGHNAGEAAAALSAGAAQIAEAPIELLPAERCTLPAMREALAILATLAPNPRRKLIDACTATVAADARITVREAELMRGVADLLDCPMPPLLAGQALDGGAPSARAERR